MVNLSNNQKKLLQDQKSHEEVCVKKYQEYAEQATDPQLKQLFQSYSQEEQIHYNTVVSILNGQVPSMNQGAQQSQTNQVQVNSTSQAIDVASQNDAMLCKDMMMTEKYVSGAYDTAIFEFSDASVRQALNHIQKEEQQHGEGILNYMNSKGLLNMLM